MLIFIFGHTLAAVIVQSSLSSYVNSWDGDLMFNVGAQEMITGILSHHANSKEDRRWRFYHGSATGVHCYTNSWTSYQNSWDGVLDFSCSSNQAMSGISSYHSNSKEDRRWKFRCCDVSGNVDVVAKRTTSFLNDWDDPVDFRCGASEVLVGLKSFHDNKKEDRKWRAVCAALVDNDSKVVGSPYSTGWLNNWDSTLSYTVTSDYAFSGWRGYHDNRREDRRFAVYKSKLSGTCENSGWSGYVNGWDAEFTYTCGGNKAMSGIISYHSNHYEDRRFRVRCCDLSNEGSLKISSIYVTGWVNEFDQEVNFKCGYEEVLVGLTSKHSNHHEDRQFKLHCGRVKRGNDLEGAMRSYVSWSGYQNDWDGELSVTTTNNQFIVGLQSRHDNNKEDRRWSVGTANLEGALCNPGAWSSYVNGYDLYLDFLCPSNHAFAGVYSIHSNYHEDRIWKFKCCDLATTGFYVLDDPLAQPLANSFDGYLHEECPQDSVLVGASSYHDSKKEDRRWSFYCSKLLVKNTFYTDVSDLHVSSSCVQDIEEIIGTKTANSLGDNTDSSVSVTLESSGCVISHFEDQMTRSDESCSSETMSFAQAYTWGVSNEFSLSTTVGTTVGTSVGVEGIASANAEVSAEVTVGMRTLFESGGSQTWTKTSSDQVCSTDALTVVRGTTLEDCTAYSTVVPAGHCTKIRKEVGYFGSTLTCEDVRELTATNPDGSSAQYDQLLDLFVLIGKDYTPEEHSDTALRYRTISTSEIATHAEAEYTTSDC